jgi:hypothetical protein
MILKEHNNLVDIDEIKKYNKRHMTVDSSSSSYSTTAVADAVETQWEESTLCLRLDHRPTSNGETVQNTMS